MWSRLTLLQAVVHELLDWLQLDTQLAHSDVRLADYVVVVDGMQEQQPGVLQHCVGSRLSHHLKCYLTFFLLKYMMQSVSHLYQVFTENKLNCVH